MRAWFSEERKQQLGYFSTFIARELRTEDVYAFQASKALPNCSLRVLKKITPAICISINHLYSSDSFISTLNTKDTYEMAHNEAFYQCLH